jgi:hypothetical protein
MKLGIIAETTMTFDITADGKPYILTMNDGGWYMNQADGSPGEYIGIGRLSWQRALAFALVEIENKAIYG